MKQSMEQPHVQLATMSRWYVVSRGIHTLAKLGIANYMSSLPVEVDKLAKATGTKPELLNRLLKFLSAYDIVTYDNGGYALTELSKPLRDDDPHSIRAVLCMVDDSWWQAFSQMDISLKTGNSAFYHQHGDDFFSFLSKSPEKQQNFDKGMAKLSTYDDDAISNAFNFSELSTLIDMGGGRGGLVKSIASRYPKLQVKLFDSPPVINQLQQTDFPANVTLESGDFLAKIPLANAYVFKGVLHDFNDETMHQILKNCAEQMPEEATLFIAEQVMPESDNPHPNKTMDIVMMVLLGGRQRTLAEWQKSIEPSGFVFQNSYKTESIFTLMEFKPNISRIREA
jgi:C-methyltransferase